MSSFRSRKTKVQRYSGRGTGWEGVVPTEIQRRPSLYLFLLRLSVSLKDGRQDTTDGYFDRILFRFR